MKKLIMSLAVAAFACATQAASVSWTISGVQDEDGNKLTTGHTYMFFATSASAAQTAISVLTGLEGKGATALAAAMSSAAWNDVKKATSAGNFSIGTSAALGKYTLPSNADLGLEGGTKYYAYAVIFDTETISDTSNYIIAQGNPTTAGITTKDDSASLTASAAFGSQAAQTWYAVKTEDPGTGPEPTTGLLLALGMAGLALRRRRA